MMRAAMVAAGLAGALTLPAAAQQAEPRAPVAAWGGVHLVGAVPTGEFADYIDAGFGLGMDVVWPVRRDGWFALRGEAGWVMYGEEKKQVCFGGGVGCRVRLDLTTTNNIFYFGLGPQLQAPAGAVRPYLDAQGGFGYFATTSSLKGNSSGEQFASDTNFDDFTLAWSGGGGLLIPLSHGRTPVLLDLGAQYHGNGSVEYLKEGDIHDQPDGTISYQPTRSQANLVSIRLGVTIGFRPGVH